jgi:hypothetical protein
MSVKGSPTAKKKKGLHERQVWLWQEGGHTGVYIEKAFVRAVT